MGTTIPEYFNQGQGLVWVQPDGPNTECKPLFCYDTDTIDEPQGGMSSHLCRKGDGQWHTVKQAQGSPGNVTTSLETWYSKTQSWLDAQVDRRCPIPLYFHHSFCGRPDIFLNYDRGKLVQNPFIESRSSGSMVKGRADPEEDMEASTRSWDLAGAYPSPEYWKLIWTLHGLGDNDPARDIAFCNAPQCLGPCGTLKDRCTDGFVGMDESAGAAATVYYTNDKGVTWSAAGGSPAFGNDIAQSSVVCYAMDRDTMRWLVAADAAVGGNLVVSYSDSVTGATWTSVTVDANSDFAPHGGCLFALDHRHIWLVTDLCDIYFNDTGGTGTWDDQGAPAPDSEANQQLNAVHFIDENVGWAVGGQPATSYLMYKTIDGGAHWEKVAPTTAPEAKMLTGVSVLDQYRVWVCNDNGKVYYSNDAGDTWTQRTMPTTPVKLGDIRFIDDFCGYVCGYRTISDSYVVVYRTFNGGYDWEEYRYSDDNVTISNYGGNALWVCDYNHVYVVTDVLATLTDSAVLELSSEAPPA